MGKLKGLPPRVGSMPARVGYTPLDKPSTAAAYDHRRGSAASRGYTGAWAKASAAYRAEHPLCVGCHAVGLFAAATLVDHIIPHKGDKALFWRRSNWQGCCDRHHNVVKQKLEQMHARGQVNDAALRLDSTVAMRMTRETVDFWT